MIAFYAHHNRPLLSNQAVLLQDLGGTGRHYLIHLRKWATEEIKWVLIRTVWALGWLHLNQSRESSGKSIPCFLLAYMFYLCGGILEAFFFFFSNHFFPVWFILMSSRKSISQEEFALTGISFQSLWILMTGEGYWDIIGQPEALVSFFPGTSKNFLTPLKCQSGSYGLFNTGDNILEMW